ncbi:ABC transporter permease [soil metagenome]
MSETLIIIQREFLARVRTKAFLIGTLVFPALLVAGIAIPAVMDDGPDWHTFAVIDEAPPGVADQLVAALAGGDDATAMEPDAEREGDRYTIRRVPGTLAGKRAELNAQVTARELDGYIWLPPDAVDSSRVVYRARNISDFGVLRDLRRAATQGVQVARMQRSGLDVAEVASLFRPVEVSGARVGAEGEEGGDAESTFWFAYIVAFLIYLLIIIHGQNVLRSVLEEKQNRIAEVLVSSVRASHLMIGKIVGVGSVVLLQLLIWTGFAALVAWQSEALRARFSIPPEIFEALRVEPWLGLSLLAFFLLGFFLYAAIYAAVGAAVTSEQEAQQTNVVILLPLIVPLMFIGRIASEPLGSLATFLGLFPLTSPLTMPMRMSAANIPALQIVLSLLLLVMGVAAVAWLAGKIYRIGILSTGKRPTLRELGRWLRTA